MRKFLGLLLMLCLLCSIAGAETVLNPTEDRNITINPADVNPMIEGYSPVTGRNLNDVEFVENFAGQAITGRYMPMMIQIDNAGGGVNSSTYGQRAPWNARYADVVYEAPLYKGGDTRLTFIYSDLIPDGVGPVRSARVFHAWLREEWDCGFVYYGQQEYTKTSVPEQFKLLGATKKGILFSGIVGDTESNPWKKYYFSRSDEALLARSQTSLTYFPAMQPHDKGVNAAMVSTLIPEGFTAANHTWLFADSLPTEGDDASTIYVTWGKSEFNSEIEWDAENKCYYRYMLVDPQGNLYADFENQEAITFNNVLVQFIDAEYPTTDAPLPTVTGSGNADFFMGGKHIAGVWQRNDLSSRTVFYGPDGNEIKLQTGRTLIIVMDGNTASRSISFE